MRMYKLVGTTPIEVSDLSEVDWTAGSIKRTFIGGSFVSTAFLGIDHNMWGEGPPILFETMVFGGRLDGEQHRSATYQDAMRQHQAAVLCLIEIKRQYQQGLIDLLTVAAIVLWATFFR